jgi:hypothetical protein
VRERERRMRLFFPPASQRDRVGVEPAIHLGSRWKKRKKIRKCWKRVKPPKSKNFACPGLNFERLANLGLNAVRLANRGLNFKIPPSSRYAWYEFNLLDDRGRSGDAERRRLGRTRRRRKAPHDTLIVFQLNLVPRSDTTC